MATPARLAMVISAKSPSGISYLLLLLTRTSSLTCKRFLPIIRGHFRMCFCLKYLAVFAMLLCFKSIISYSKQKISYYNSVHILSISLFRFTSFGAEI